MVMVMVYLYRVWPLPYLLPFPNPVLITLLFPILLLLVVLVPGSSSLLLELAMVPPDVLFIALLVPSVPFSAPFFQQSVNAGPNVILLTTMLDGDASLQILLPTRMMYFVPRVLALRALYSITIFIPTVHPSVPAPMVMMWESMDARFVGGPQVR